jgi:hypothetical protein
LLVVVDGLRVGEIGKYLFRGLGDNVLTLRHSVPRFLRRTHPGLRRSAQDQVKIKPKAAGAVFSCTA